MQLQFSDGTRAEYTFHSEFKPYMLFCGTAHDRAIRLRIAERARNAGFTVKDADGTFGTVIVEARHDQYASIAAIEEVTSAVLDDSCGCLTYDVCPMCNQ